MQAVICSVILPRCSSAQGRASRLPRLGCKWGPRGPGSRDRAERAAGGYRVSSGLFQGRLTANGPGLPGLRPQTPRRPPSSFGAGVQSGREWPLQPGRRPARLGGRWGCGFLWRSELHRLMGTRPWLLPRAPGRQPTAPPLPPLLPASGSLPLPPDLWLNPRLPCRPNGRSDWGAGRAAPRRPLQGRKSGGPAAGGRASFLPPTGGFEHRRLPQAGECGG